MTGLLHCAERADPWKSRVETARAREVAWNDMVVECIELHSPTANSKRADYTVMMGRRVTPAPRMTPSSTDVTSIRTLAVVCVLGVVSAVDLAAQTTVAGDKPQYCVGE